MMSRRMLPGQWHHIPRRVSIHWPMHPMCGNVQMQTTCLPWQMLQTQIHRIADSQQQPTPPCTLLVSKTTRQHVEPPTTMNKLCHTHCWVLPSQTHTIYVLRLSMAMMMSRRTRIDLPCQYLLVHLYYQNSIPRTHHSSDLAVPPSYILRH